MAIPADGPGPAPQPVQPATVDADPPPNLEEELITVPPVAADASAGETVGDAPPGYELLGELGRGGMGVVYKARQVGLNRIVALKMVLAGAHAGGELRQRFRAEAEAVAKVRHPGIVQIFEIGEHHGQPYFALEFVAGGSLDRHLNGTPLPPRDAAALIAALADAMGAAHQAGVVHRDLKPANVLGNWVDRSSPPPNHLTTQPPKITDFGLAKLLDQDSGQTKTGQVMGTPSYVAPEQAEGKRDVGPLADVYALGAILYECLTGRPPFKAATPLDTVLQVLSEDPVPPSRLQPKTPRDLETICLKCLAKAPERRYASARELAEDLRRFGAGEPIRARPVGPFEKAVKWARRRPAAALGMAVTAAAAAALLGLWAALTESLRQERNAADEARRAAEFQSIRADARTTDARTSAAEARRLVGHYATVTGLQRIADGDLFGGLLWCAEPLRRTPEQEAAARERLGNYLRHAAYPVAAQFFAPEGRVTGATFSPDGQFVFVRNEPWSTTPEVRIWDVATARTVVGPVEVVGTLGNQLHFSPDGRGFLVSRSQTVGILSGDVVERRDARTGQPLGPPLEVPATLRSLTHSPDGRRLITTAGVTNMIDPNDLPNGRGRSYGEARVWDGATGRPITPPLKHAATVTAAALSPDGRRLATASDDATARIWDAATGQPLTEPLPHPGGVWLIAWSPDGRQLVTVAFQKAASLHRWDAATGRPLGEPVTFPRSWGQAWFLPDGRRVRFWGPGQVAVWDTATGAIADVTPAGAHGHRHLTADPTGARLVTLDPANGVHVWDVDAGRELGPALPAAWAEPRTALSPDGRRLAVAGGRQVQVWDVAGGQPFGAPVSQAAHVNLMAWSPDGTQLLTSGSSGREGQVYEAATGRPVGPPLPGVEAVAFGPAPGQLVAHGGGRLTVLDRATGLPVRPPIQLPRDAVALLHPAGGRGVVLSREGRTTLCKVWDLAEAKVVRWLALFAGTGGAEPREVRSALSADGRRLAVGYQKAVEVWDLETGQLRAAIPWPQNLRFLAASADGEAAAVGTGNGLYGAVTEVRTVALTGTRAVGARLAHPGAVLSAALSPDGRLAATAGLDQTVRLWDRATGQAVGSPLTHADRVEQVTFSPDGQMLLTRTAGHAVQVWRVATGQPVTPPLPHQETPAAAFHPDGRRWLTADEAGVRVWDPAGTPAAPPAGWGPVRHPAFSPDGRRFTAGGIGLRNTTQEAAVREVATGRPLFPPLPFPGYVHSALSPDGRRLATLNLKVNTLPGDGLPMGAAWRLWDAATGQPLTPAIPTFRQMTQGRVMFSPDGTRVATVMTGMIAGGASGVVQVWDAATGQPVGQPMQADKARMFVAAAFSPDGARLAAGAYYVENGSWQSLTEVRLWDTTTGQPAGPAIRFPQLLNQLSFSPDGRRLVLAGGRGQDQTGHARVVDAATGQPVTPELTHREDVVHAAFSPDGRWVATASRDKTLRVWDAATGQSRTPPLAHGEPLQEAVFSPDGRAVLGVSGLDGDDRPGEARLWDAATGLALSPPLRPGFPVRNAAFTADGRHVILAGATRARGYDLTPTDRPAADLFSRLALLATRRLDDVGGAQPLTAAEQRQAEADQRSRYPADYQVTPPQVAAWHRAAAADARAAGDWAAAVRHYDRVVGPEPDDAEAWFQKGYAHSQLREWAATVTASGKALELEPWRGWAWTNRSWGRLNLGDYAAAAADAERAIALLPDDPTPRANRAAARCGLAAERLGAGDLAGYRAACAALAAETGAAAPADQANAAAWTCALGPGAVTDWAPVLRLAERAAGTPTANTLNTLGAVQYRAGRPADAVVTLQKAVAQRGGKATFDDALFLALAHFELGRHVEVSRWWAEAEAAYVREKSTGGRGEQLQRRILRAEAAARFAVAEYLWRGWEWLLLWGRPAW